MANENECSTNIPIYMQPCILYLSHQNIEKWNGWSCLCHFSSLCLNSFFLKFSAGGGLLQPWEHSLPLSFIQPPSWKGWHCNICVYPAICWYPSLSKCLKGVFLLLTRNVGFSFGHASLPQPYKLLASWFVYNA